MKVGYLVRYLGDGDIGVITRIDEYGMYWVQFVSGGSCDCVHSELRVINESR
jgi:hypothetical protein